MPFQIIRNDIVKVKADAIVNTANPHPAYGEGTDGDIYRAAGEDALLAERRKIGNIPVGQAFATPAFALNAKYIIHTVGPVWRGGTYGEREAIQSCYEASLQRALELECESIAFPLISTGTYGFPKDEGLRIALSVFRKFLLKEEMTIYLVVYDRKAFELSSKLSDEIQTFIDDNYIFKKRTSPSSRWCESESESWDEDRNMHAPVSAFPQTLGHTLTSVPRRSLDDVVQQLGETFQQRLFRLMDERKLSEVELYKKANLDRKLFSKIRCNPEYKPKKKTAIALAIALNLNLDETKDLLGRAELALSPSSKSDLIIEYFITNHIYDIYTINVALFQHNLSTLGE